MVQHQPLADPEAQAPAKVLEVGDGAVVHVRRLVPLVGQRLGHGHAAERHLQARAPMAEIRKADDRLAPDAQHLAQDAFGMAHRLQRLRKDHAVERMIREQRQPALQVDLQHVDVVRHAGDHAVVVDLHAVAWRRARLPQVAQQRAVAAAEVEHARAAIEPLRDGGEIGARGEQRLSGGGHSSRLAK